ncbi:MAG: methylenetetrahydrofolate reductase [NAD(P)H] [Lachnospiraceae bacterium]|nr:methylenetetrahydrofolate reductase [NAD(P)H] [Candidatus Colinaster scatohippi]
MKLNYKGNNGKVTLSFEVFPPKQTANYETVYQAAMGVAALKPHHMSVTYGAGGSTRSNTFKIAEDIQNKYEVPVIAHLTCVGASKEDTHLALDAMKKAGIRNILALRGDKPRDFEGDPFVDFKYATELVKEIRDYSGDYFCIGGACYPEGHPDAFNKAEDIEHLKEKVDAGCDFLTTQMFFDNNIFYNFLYKIKDKGINVPVTAGIMPITRANQVENAIKLSGSNMPERFRNLVDHFGTNPAAMQQAGIAYATDQIIDLIANGVEYIHIYSMNKPEVAEGIMNNLSEIIK